MFYGDNFNWWAAYALWVFTLFGHHDVPAAQRRPGQVDRRGPRGRPAIAPSAKLTDYPVVTRDDAPIRAFRDQVLAHISTGRPLVDVRSPGEYTGELLHMPDYPQEGALRGGHIPGAVSKPWKQAANDDGTFRVGRRAEPRSTTTNSGSRPADDIIAYCRIGERSSHTWFVLTHLLGYPQVRNYDGSWTEWGNLVRVPVAQGTEPGGLRAGTGR